jgi:carbonic anhydrase
LILEEIWQEAAENANIAVNATDDFVVSNETAYEIKVKDSPLPMKLYSSFLPSSRDYYTYTGSLTTYPCSEGIQFIVMKDPVLVTKYDISRMRKSVSAYPTTIINSFKNDNRPVQPLIGRVVKSYSANTAGAQAGLAASSASCPNNVRTLPFMTLFSCIVLFQYFCSY